jgi:hypothetical protein
MRFSARDYLSDDQWSERYTVTETIGLEDKICSQSEEQ